MSRGCIWTLVGIGVTLLLLIIVVIAVPLIAFDIATTASRVPVTTFITPDTVLALSIDPRQSGIPEMWAEGAYQNPAVFNYILPYELGMVADVDAPMSTRTMTFMASPRHLGPVFEYFFGDPEIFSATEEMDVGGIETWDTPAFTKENGALILRGHGAISSEDREFVKAHWPGASPVPIALEGGHLAELFIANGDGRGFLALANQGIGQGYETPETTGAEQIDAGSSLETDTAAEPEPPLTALDAVKATHSLRATLDFEEPDLYLIRVSAMCPDEVSAKRAKVALDAVVESVLSGPSEEGVSLSGDLIPVGNEVSGELRVTGVRPMLVRLTRERSR